MLFHEGSTLLGVVNALRLLAYHGAAPKISQQPASPVGQAA